MKNIRLRCCRLFHILFGRCAHSRQRDKFVIYFIDHTGSENNLQLTGCFKHAFYTIHIIQRFFVAFFVVCDHKPQTGSAMSG